MTGKLGPSSGGRNTKVFSRTPSRIGITAWKQHAPVSGSVKLSITRDYRPAAGNDRRRARPALEPSEDFAPEARTGSPAPRFLLLAGGPVVYFFAASPPIGAIWKIL